MSNLQKIILPVSVILLVFGVVPQYTDFLLSTSPDMSHHYALTYRIFETMSTVFTNDPSLGEMNFYPSNSHVLAAVLGHMTGSVFAGMNAIAVAALLLVWVGILGVLKGLADRVFLVATILLVGAVFVNFETVRLTLHGFELIGNYYFAQIFGIAIMYLCIACAAFIEKQKSAALGITFLSIISVVMTGIHLLPTVILVGTVWVLATLYFIENWGNLKKRNTLFVILFPVISIAGVILNPSFSAMAKIAKFNGGMWYLDTNYPTGFFQLSVIATMVSFGLFAVWFTSARTKENSAYKYLIALGFAVPVLCIMQYYLLSQGFGSEYAVKKYVFNLLTFIFVGGAVLISALLNGLFDKLSVKQIPQPPKLVSTVIFLGASFILFSTSLSGKQLIETQKVIETEQSLSDFYAQNKEEVKGTVAVAGLNDMPNSFNYMFSLAFAKTPRHFAEPHVMSGRLINDLKPYSYIVTSKGSSFAPKECPGLETSGISGIKKTCLAESLKKIGECGAHYDFSSNGAVNPKEILGFSDPDQYGRWNNGTKVTFQCDMSEKKASKIRIVLRPYIFGPQKEQNITPVINGTRFNPIKFPVIGYNTLELDLTPLNIVDEFKIELEMPNAISPKETGENNDTRKLAFKIKTISFE
ncbi:hypothetical protein [Terasakiella sp.]|uniref:hypothetical protein n=1 Tax=Terasakiella sp. TaxID=2034861 RepID=UPI003AA83830